MTAALRLSILRAPSRATARRAASAPTASGVGRSCAWRVERPSPPRSMPAPSPAMAEAESEKLEAVTSPSKPSLVTSAQPPWLQPAEAPSVLVTPGVWRTTSSAARARCSRASASNSVGSRRSRSGGAPRARRSFGAKPA